MFIETPYCGFLFIGDPHLASRNPGFRKDDYPHAALGKLAWSLDHAQGQRLLPVLLGDLFHWPRDNANWVLTEIIQLLAGREVIAVTGNHDTTEKILRSDDSLSVVEAAGGIRLIDRTGPWRGRIGDAPVIVSGTSWSGTLPRDFDREDAALSIHLAHHNIRFADGDDAWRKPRPIPGIDLVVNGHLHRPMPDVVCESTTWMNPGNIARVMRSDAVKAAVPAALRLDVSRDGTWSATRVVVPHRPFDEVFHDMGSEIEGDGAGSQFIKGLESLRTLKTHGGAGLLEFLDRNLGNFDSAVAGEIRSLANEVCTDGPT